MRTFSLTIAIVCMAVLPPSLSSGGVDLSVHGLGLRADKRNERLLKEVLDVGDKPDSTIDAAVVEDALILLRNELARKGYLSPEINYSLYSGNDLVYKGSGDFVTVFPGVDLGACDLLAFDVEKGVRAHVETVAFDGLHGISAQEASAYFLPPGGLFVSRAARAYSPPKLESQLRSLKLRLGQIGYQEAVVGTAATPVVESTGEVNLLVRVSEGPRHVWGTASSKSEPAIGVSHHPEAPAPGGPFSTESLQDWIAEVRKQYLLAGYPDTVILTHQERQPAPAGNEAIVNVVLEIAAGPRVRMGSVRFSGIGHSDENFLRKLVRLEEGSWLSRPEIQSAQFRLGQLGIFGRVQSQIEDQSFVDGVPSRNVVFNVTERERQSVSMLFGYGSYEQFRFGLEARTLNLLGRGHRGHIRLRQSMRSSAGSLYYTVPRPLPWLSSGQIRLQGLLREEVSFDREEALAAVGVERNFLGGSLRTTAEYRFELLQSKGFEPLVNIGDTNTVAGSLSFGFSWDTRDQVVTPRKGASLQGILELASKTLGSETNYQRMIVRSSYHHSFDNGWLRSHLGFEGGLLTRLGSDPFEFPTNKRFFPGGENSIRGYKEGEASPLDPEGTQIGAEAYALAHVELELALSDSLSIVVFTDGLWATPYVDSGSDGESLYSSGLGLRYSTPLGPLRLEYAHNLNPRPTDPDGTLHVSVGFPF